MVTLSRAQLWYKFNLSYLNPSCLLSLPAECVCVLVPPAPWVLLHHCVIKHLQCSWKFLITLYSVTTTALLLLPVFYHTYHNGSAAAGGSSSLHSLRSADSMRSKFSPHHTAAAGVSALYRGVRYVPPQLQQRPKKTNLGGSEFWGGRGMEEFWWWTFLINFNIYWRHIDCKRRIREIFEILI